MAQQFKLRFPTPAPSRRRRAWYFAAITGRILAATWLYFGAGAGG
jgi:hypothetical protein